MDEQRRQSSAIAGPDLRAALDQYLQDDRNIQQLYGIMRHMVARSALVAAGDDFALWDTTRELFQATLLRACELASKQHEHPVNIRAWLLSIAQYVLKERRHQRQKEQQVILIREIAPQEHETDALFFTLFHQQTDVDPAQQVERREELREALSSLSESDRQLISLYLHYGRQHKDIAHLLKITPAAARTRYMRALRRLQAAWTAQHEQRRGERHG